MTDHGFISLGKYSSARDSILHFLCAAEWSNDSFGDVEAPTGYVWRISNDPEDIFDVFKFGNPMEIDSVLDEWFTDNSEVTDSPALRAELVGHFLVTEDSQGFIGVTSYPSEALLMQAYESLEGIFSGWRGDND